MEISARFAMTYFGDDLPPASGTISRMLPEVSYTIATATPSASAANKDPAVPAMTRARNAAITRTLDRCIRIKLAARNAASLANSFIRCQHILGFTSLCIYKTYAAL